MEIDTVNKTVTLNAGEARYFYTVLSERPFKSMRDYEIDMLMKLHLFFQSF